MPQLTSRQRDNVTNHHKPKGRDGRLQLLDSVVKGTIQALKDLMVEAGSDQSKMERRSHHIEESQKKLHELLHHHLAMLNRDYHENVISRPEAMCIFVLYVVKHQHLGHKSSTHIHDFIHCLSQIQCMLALSLGGHSRKPSKMELIPCDVLSGIFQYTSPADLQNLSRTCGYFRRILIYDEEENLLHWALETLKAFGCCVSSIIHNLLRLRQSHPRLVYGILFAFLSQKTKRIDLDIAECDANLLIFIDLLKTYANSQHVRHVLPIRFNLDEGSLSSFEPLLKAVHATPRIRDLHLFEVCLGTALEVARSQIELLLICTAIRLSNEPWRDPSSNVFTALEAHDRHNPQLTSNFREANLIHHGAGAQHRIHVYIPLSMKRIRCERVFLSNSWVEMLALPNIQDIRLSHVCFDDFDPNILHITGSHAWRDFAFISVQLTNDDVDWLFKVTDSSSHPDSPHQHQKKAASNLTSLDLSWNHLESLTSDMLGDLVNRGEENSPLPDFGTCHNLVVLRLDHNPDIYFLSATFVSRKLIDLSLKSCDIIEIDERLRLSSLRKLDISGNHFLSDGFSILYLPKLLTELRASNCGLSQCHFNGQQLRDAGKEAVTLSKHLDALQELELDNNEGITSLDQDLVSSVLIHLTLNSCSLEHIDSTIRHTTLRHLSINHCHQIGQVYAPEKLPRTLRAIHAADCLIPKALDHSRFESLSILDVATNGLQSATRKDFKMGEAVQLIV